MARGWLIAAPQSGAGKTTVTLAVLRALRDRGTSVAPFKSGPDYIDPAFHEVAAGATSFNLDAWAMRPERLRALVAAASGPVIVEAAMGLFDGAADGSGSAAELARLLDLDVILVVDCARQSHSVAALVHGFATFDPALRIAGIVLNRVASARHEAMLRAALRDHHVLGAVPRDAALALPERHLGLVQARERADLETFLLGLGRMAERHLDLSIFEGAAYASRAGFAGALEPLGQRIAIAHDEAFAFAYPHWLADWRGQGAAILPFSPLADEGPPDDADAVFLPGGYPELHGGRLANAAGFRERLREAAARGATIYGECGGYMVLGEALTDAEGATHRMTGLLPVETSFETPRRHLGYREIGVLDGTLMGHQRFRGHEFHYSTCMPGRGTPLFHATDALGRDLGSTGLRAGNVAGGWLHLIDGIAE